MIFLGFLLASLTAVDSQVRPLDVHGAGEWPNNNAAHQPHSPNHPKSNTVIENKNVNIIVNVDPKDVAKELYKLLQGHLDERQLRRLDTNKQTINELEKIVTPVVTPTRRSNRPTAFEVAYSLDHLTRKALLTDHLTRPTIDDEILTRDVVARMMLKLKEITEKDKAANYKSEQRFRPVSRRMLDSTELQSEEEDDSSDEDDDRYLNINVRIRKSEILKRTTITRDY